MLHTPSYRTYTLQCPANAAKLEAVQSWVCMWRELAELELDHQISRFRATGGKQGLETAASKGWTRPWVADGRCSTTMAQQVMAQVSSQLQGHIGILKNAVQALISDQAKAAGWDSDERHRLYSLNRHGLWWARSGVKSPIKGEGSLPRETLRQGRKLLLQALRQHRLPSFANYHPQLDQRNCVIEFARRPGSTFPLWARVSPACNGQVINLPLVGWKQLMETVAATSAALAPGQAERLALKRERQARKRQEAGKPPVDTAKQRNLAPDRAALPHTLRLILTAHEGPITTAPALRVALVLDHSAHDNLLRADYVPTPGKTVATDLGLDVLLATCDGDLLGRDWMHRLEHYSRVIDAIAAHRQRLGLPVRSARYDAWVAKLDGFMKTNIYRLVNRWVARVKPERIIVSDDGWQPGP